MATPLRLALFGTALIVVFAASFQAGRAVGPVDDHDGTRRAPVSTSDHAPHG
jgi:hypothetical protein